MDGATEGHITGPAPGRTDALYGNVLDPDFQTIVAALAGRVRYRYVQPVVLPEVRGWKIVSPNCSRQIDPEGGLIDIAYLLPCGASWQLFAHDHRQQRWVLQAEALTLAEAMDRVCLDPFGIFWP